MAVSKVTLSSGKVRWRLRFLVATDPETGRQHMVTRTFDRKKDADQEEARLLTLTGKGGTVARSKEPLGKYLERWLMDVKRHTLRPRTYADYMGVLKRYVTEPPEETPPLGKVPLNALTVDGLQSLYAYLQDQEGLSPRTIRSLHAVIRQGLQRAFKTGAVAANVADLVDLPEQDRRKVTAMSEEESKAFLKAARGDRYYPLWCVLLTGGLRPSEALALTWPDVDWEAGTVRVQRTLTRRGEASSWELREPKTDQAVRPVALPSFTMKALKEWKAKQAAERLRAGAEYQDHGFVFPSEWGKPLDLPNLYARNFKRIMEAAGLGTRGPEPDKPASGPRGKRPFTPKYRLYDLRHTAATALLRAGIHPKIVSERLGHAKVSFTLDVYSASVPDLQSRAVEALEALYAEG
jgi:integrase